MVEKFYQLSFLIKGNKVFEYLIWSDVPLHGREVLDVARYQV